ncbi:MAG: Ig-like domain-containing protein, partial [Lachnospiraceae bacterium]|nr:Ig-like domain-containing protein [Lachnospiraceae bacterium]
VNFSGGTINFTERGSYYIHTLVKDNAGNEVIRTFGPYVINNSTPVANDTSVGVWEHEKNGNGANKVIIDLRGLVSDVDVSDTLTFTVSQTPDTTYGTWKATATAGVYEFTHSGYGVHPFKNVLEAKYYVTDNFGAKSDTKTITINVTEVNDVPDAPKKFDPASGIYKDGDTINLSFTEGKDEETPASGLVYEIQVSYNGGTTWDEVNTITTSAGQTAHNFTFNTGGLSDTVRFRVRTVDNHATLPIEKSAWLLSPVHILDNIKPSFNVTAESLGSNYIIGTDATEQIDITFSYSDLGGSELNKYGYVLSNSSLAPANLSSYQMLSTANGNSDVCRIIGNYYLHLYAIDNAGNEYFQTYGPFKLTNTKPTALPQTVTVDEGDAVIITLEGTDKDYQDYITAYILESSPLHGTLTQAVDGDGNIIANMFIYQHDGSELPNDGFEFSVFDSYGTKSSSALVTIIINPVNDPPEIMNLNPVYTIDEDSVYPLIFNIGDPDNIPDELSIDIQVGGSTVIGRDRMKLTRNPSGELTLTLTPKPDQFTLPGQPVLITITVTDPDGLSVQETIEVHVSPVNDAPVAEDQYYTIVGGGKVVGHVDATDIENDPLTYSVIADATAGTFTPDADFATNGKFTYTPNPGTAADSVKIRIDDGNTYNNFTEITLYFTVQIRDHEDHTYITREIAFDADVPISAVSSLKVTNAVSNPGFISASKCKTEINGTIVSIIMEIAPDAFGEAVLHLELKSNSGLLVTDIDVIIEPRNDAPVAAPIILKIKDGLNRSINGVIAANDKIDGIYTATGFMYEMSSNLFDQPEHGTVQLHSDGTFTYVPDIGYYGHDEFYVLVTEVGNNPLNKVPDFLPDGVVVMDADGNLQIKVLVTVEMLTRKPTPNNPSGSHQPGTGSPASEDEEPPYSEGEPSETIIIDDTQGSGVGENSGSANNTVNDNQEGSHPELKEKAEADSLGILEWGKNIHAGLINAYENIFDPDGNFARHGFAGASTVHRTNIDRFCPLILLIALLILLFLILLFVMRIKVEYITKNEEDEETVIKRTLFFRRLHYRKKMRLNISYRKVEDIKDVTVVIRAGIVYRRRHFYEHELRIIFDSLYVDLEVPEKKVYKDNGIAAEGSRFESL